MTKNIRTHAILLVAMVFSTAISAQDKTAEAKKYFADTKSTAAVRELIKKSLPTRDECAMVFNGTDADTYYQMVEKIKAQLLTDLPKSDDKYLKQSFTSFTTEDVVAGKGNYISGMAKIAGRLKPGLTFYELKLESPEGMVVNSVDYKYWTFVNNRWVYLPKMPSAFKKE